MHGCNDSVGARFIAPAYDTIAATSYELSEDRRNMNFIFDIGNVLINYKPLEYLEGLFSEHSLIERLNQAVFLSQEWVYLDLGIITYREACDSLCTREPDIEQDILSTMRNVHSMFTPITETVELLPEIKSSGHRLYYLSNIHKETRDYLLREYRFFDLFDGGVYSCDINIMKPSPEIYRYLMSSCKLNPDDCLFFDDVKENVIAASNEGIKGVLFTGAECVRPFLK